MEFNVADMSVLYSSEKQHQEGYSCLSPTGGSKRKSQRAEAGQLLVASQPSASVSKGDHDIVYSAFIETGSEVLMYSPHIWESVGQR